MTALQFIAQKKLLPTGMSSAELSALDSDVRNQSLFSARTLYADYLQQIKDNVSTILNPVSVEGRTEGLDRATARLQAKETLARLGYSPDPTERGTLKDLSSDDRINLVLKMNTEMAQGFGQFAQGQDPAVLDQWPAQELFRAEGREKPRDWEQRWAEAGGQMFGSSMIALKDDPIWSEISAFQNPFPPFDYNSGMWVRDVDRSEAEALGLIEPGQRVEPQEITYPVQHQEAA